MQELGEPAGERRKGEEISERCSLHFIRCIKPNDFASDNMFVDSLVLLQIGYMGVLDSVKVRKLNFPHRMKYDRFYERYEELCSVSSSRPIRELREIGADFADLSRRLMKEQLGEQGKSLYALGSTRIFMRDEIVAVLEQAREYAIARKEMAATFLQDGLPAALARRAHARHVKCIMILQRFWIRRLRTADTFRALRFALKAEQALSKFRADKRRALEVAACTRLAQVLFAGSVRCIVARGMRARRTMAAAALRLSGRTKVRKVVFGLRLVRHLVDTAWRMVKSRQQEKASATLVRMARGYLARKAFERQIRLAKEVA